MESADAKFIHDPTAPKFFAHGLHDVEVIGANCEFTLFAYARTERGALIRVPPFYCTMPIDAVGPAIALTWEKCGGALLLPAIGKVAGGLLRSWRLH